MLTIFIGKYSITDMTKGLSLGEKKELFELFQAELEERYGYSIEELETMEYGLMPDITE